MRSVVGGRWCLGNIEYKRVEKAKQEPILTEHTDFFFFLETVGVKMDLCLSVALCCLNSLSAEGLERGE